MMTRSVPQQVLVALGLLAAPGGPAYREHAPPPPPPAPGLQAAAGVEATMFAQAPLLTNPIAIDVDARGRVWLTEGHNYRLHMHPDYPVRQEGDRIRILEDTDGDGVADTAKTFYQGRDVDAALGIVVLGNRVIVSAYENVYVFSDTNGDDRADEKRVLFKRGPANSDHSTHSFVFGPDGRLYFNAGNDAGPLKDPDGNVLSDRAGRRIVPDSGAYRQGIAVRMRPDGSDLEVIAHNFRNPFELALDSYGSVWQSDNDDDGNRSARINYLMEFGNYGFRDAVTGASWPAHRANMESEIPLRHWHQNDPGVVPNLMITGAGSPAGLAFYEGELLPAPFRNVMIHADAGPGVVRAYPVDERGAGYAGRIANLLRAPDDPKFRPVDVAAAPDGSLFVADWYDPIVGGHAAEDFTQGRIIRLAPAGAAARAYRVTRPDLSTAAGAARALRSPNMATRYLAYTKLAELGAGAEPALRQLWSSQDPRLRARALWLLAQLPEGVGARYVDQAVADPSPDIRITGLRAARLVRHDVLGYAERLMNDPSPRVRREVAVALRYEAAGPRAAAVWTRLARQYDGEDRWYLEALGIAADGKWDAFLPAWLDAIGDGWNTSAGRDIVWRARADAALPLLARLIRNPSATPRERERYFRALDFHKGPARERTLLGIVEDPGSDARTVALGLMALDSASARMTPELRTAVDRALEATRGSMWFVTLARKFDARAEAAELLRLALARPDSSAGVEAARLVARWQGIEGFRAVALGADTAAARRAIVALSYVGGAQAQEAIEGVALSRDRPLAVRRAAVLAFARVNDRRLLQLVEAKQLPEELHDAARTVLFRTWRPEVRRAAATLLGAPAPRGHVAAGGKPLPPAAELASRRGHPARGRTVFRRACASCHQAEGVGVGFGPPLSAIGDKLPKIGLYQAILEPSAGIAFGYEGESIRLRDGSESVGIPVNDTPTELALKVVGGATVRHSKAQVAWRTPLETSLMPEGLESALTEQQLVDLVEYLASLRRVRQKQ